MIPGSSLGGHASTGGGLSLYMGYIASAWYVRRQRVRYFRPFDHK